MYKCIQNVVVSTITGPCVSAVKYNDIIMVSLWVCCQNYVKNILVITLNIVQTLMRGNTRLFIYKHLNLQPVRGGTHLFPSNTVYIRQRRMAVAKTLMA